jgi:hypothetical protein
MIRKALSPSYYDAADPEWSHLLSEKHTSHCIDSLRQSLMCASDITPIVWIRDEENKLRPEGRVIHTCRNFEAIRQWARDNQIGQNADLSQFVNM